MTDSLPSPAPRGVASRLGAVFTFLRILNARLRFIFIMVFVGILAAKWETMMNYWERWMRPSAAAAASADIEYFCPMHPAIIAAAPSSCPLCGMPLSKRAKSDRPALPEGVLAQVSLTPHKVRIGRIGTSPIEYRLLSREIRTVGIVEYDETLLAFVAARFMGRLDELTVNYVGQQVGKGDKLASIYSPDLLVAQEEVLTTHRNYEQQKGLGGPAEEVARTVYEAARRKLLLWGITEEQVEDIVRHSVPETHLTLYSPIPGIVTEKNVLKGAYVKEGDRLYTIADLSSVWMQAKVFEDQFAGIQVGTAVEVTSTAYPAEVFAGRITFIAFNVDPSTRTVAARVQIANPNYKLRPGMYATATIRLPVGAVTPMDPPSDEEEQESDSEEASEPAPEERVTTAFVRAYLDLAADYAEDETDALPDFIKAARRLAEEGSEKVRDAAKRVASLAEKLTDKDLEAQREGFKKVSTEAIALLRADPPRSGKLYVAHCPMVEADWIQEVERISNPYASYMPRCGEIAGAIVPGAASESERYATGYFSPIYPDRLFDAPGECPVDKFPMRYVRIDKVPAVPVSAVIDTGTRKVVYRESAPGVFDMIEVRLGARAGEYYPLIEGLNVDDAVATAGAFLVDAENRLNPAASVQYFGASDAPGK